MAEFDTSGRDLECSEKSISDDTSAVSVSNQSLIGKMKSRVSGIFPNKISNWFKSTSSPIPQNSKDNSLNGSSDSSATGDNTNKIFGRRRIELREDDDDDDEDWGSGEDENGYINYKEAAIADDIAEHDVDEGEVQTHSDFALNMLRQQTLQKRPGIRAREEDDDNGNESEHESHAAPSNSNQQMYDKRTLQSASKRTRLSVDFSLRDTPMVNRHSFIASTPAVRSGALMKHNSAPMSLGASSTATRTHVNRYNYMNLYRNQQKREPGYNFGAATTEVALATSGDLPTTTDSSVNVNLNERNQSFRRNLMIPNLSEQQQQTKYTLPHHRRQSLATVKSFGGDSLTGATPLRTSTMIVPSVITEQDETNDGHGHQTININNNNINEKQNSSNAHQNLLNGDSTRVVTTTTDVVSQDTASEASNEEQGYHNNKDNGIGGRSRTSSFGGNSGLNINSRLQGPKSPISGSNQSRQGPQGINNSTMSLNSLNCRRQFNASVYDSRSPSRGGNSGLNFNAHLQSPKSLFSGTNQPRQGPEEINNSTMSLNSLNYRRQFNASVYGSTSALSDSRLYNTMSPFYKGRTTYGGASAYTSYNKILSGTDGNTDAGSTFLRLKPTVIRPQSSLSTLSSSNNSLTAGGASGVTVNPSGIATIKGENINISNAAQRILSLLNDYSSPLTEAKKMGENLKDYNEMLQSKRLKGSDVESSRKSRLANRSPYLRPSPFQTGLLGRSGISNNKQGSSKINIPVRELQVPKVSHWMKMRQQMHNSTERIRKIAMEQPTNDFFKMTNEYKLPDANNAACKRENGSGNANVNKEQPVQSIRQAKHTGKIRHKVTSHARATNCIDDGRLDEVLPPVELPQIAFPFMQSVPQFDIELPKSVAGAKPSTSSSQSLSSLKRKLEADCTNLTDNQSSPLNKNYDFSMPINLSKPKEKVNLAIIKSFNFSPPSSETSQGLIQTMKTNSMNSNKVGVDWKSSQDNCFTDTRNSSVEEPIASDKTKSKAAGEETFGNIFKMSKSEWECDICMVRNKESALKCVACETPRCDTATMQTKTSTVVDAIPLKNNLSTASNSFGSAFKPKADTWECNVCLIMNKKDADKCAACESKKPGAVTTIDNNASKDQSEKPKFKFGFSNAASDKGKTTVVADDTFKSLAATQKASKWSCSACFAQNDAIRKICMCCEEPKPGTLGTPDNGVKFSFGQANPSSSSTQFKFGFGNANVSVCAETSTTTIVSSASSIATAATTSPFGIQTATSSITTTSGPDATDGVLKSGFKFGFGSGTDTVNSGTTTSSSIQSTIEKTTVNTTKSVSFNLPTIDLTTAIPSTGFKLGSSLTAPETVTATTSATLPSGGFAFNPVTTQTSVGGIAASSETSTSGKFSFTPIKSVATSSESSIATSNIQSILSTTTNASATTLATSSASSPPKMFSFGSFGSTTNSSTTSTMPISSPLVGVFTAKPTNSSLSTNVAVNPSGATAATTTLVSGSTTTTGTSNNNNSDSTISGGKFNFPQLPVDSTSSTFIFGAQPAATVVTSTVTKTTASIFGATTSTIKNSFASNPPSTFFFGSNENNVPATTGPANSGNKDGTTVASSPIVFGNFGGDKAPLTTTAPTSTFGTPVALGGGVPASTSVFNVGGTAASNSQMSFSTNATPTFSSGGFASPSASSPVFGGATKFGSAATQGSNMFAINNSGSTNLTTFGMQSTTTSTGGVMMQQQQQQQPYGSFVASNTTLGPPPAKQKPFGGFGGTTPLVAPAGPPSFNFNAPNVAMPTAQPTTSGVFNFSANVGTANTNAAPAPLKPAFNFTATAPTANFNFTGSATNANSTGNDVNKPFIFGQTTMNSGFGQTIPTMNNNNNNYFNYTPASHLFSFGGNHLMMEASSNAPFQFNAGAAPTTNIFAINPSNSGGLSSQTAAQQARRKIRTPNRRLTPR